jgi:hypothetical protein
MNQSHRTGIITATLLLTIAGGGFSNCPSTSQETQTKVKRFRVPDRGIQPQALTDTKGVVHLIYYQGDPSRGDVYYVRSDDGAHFSNPLRVNRHPRSAIAMGNIRGAHPAVGKNGRVHVAWMGSDQAAPRGPNKAQPMLYARLNDDGTAFEPERNVISAAYGLDGGGSLAGDPAGNVYVTWHAPMPDTVGEANRCVWVAHSADEGRTFAAEKRANSDPTGACGCCGMRLFCDKKGAVYCLYRSAEKVVHRDMHLLLSHDRGDSFKGEKLHDWNVGGCPMSSEAFSEGPDGVYAAWETDGQVYFARVDPATGKRSALVAAPGVGKGRRFPAIAVNSRGELLLAWTEGVQWGRGGAAAWQVFDKAGKPTAEHGRADGVPPWSLVSAFVRPDGSFTLVY